MAFFKIYQRDRGKVGRLLTLAALLLFSIWGATAFHHALRSLDTNPLEPFWGAQLNVPVIGNELAGVPISPSLIGGVGLFAILALAIYWVVNSARPADLLADTESEMRRVNWPKREESINSSVVVIATVIVFTAFIFVADYALHYLMVLIRVYPPTSAAPTP